MFRHAIFRRRAGLVLLPSFRGIVSITGWGGHCKDELLGACSSQAQGSSSRSLGSSCKQMENRSYSRFMGEVKWWFRACRGFGDGPGLAFVALGRLQRAEASSLVHLQVREAGGGARERLANEKETPHGPLNSARGEKGTKGKVRSSRAKEVVGGNQSLPRSWESGSVFYGQEDTRLARSSGSGGPRPGRPSLPGSALLAHRPWRHSATCWKLASISGAHDS